MGLLRGNKRDYLSGMKYMTSKYVTLPVLAILSAACGVTGDPARSAEGECVVLLHGLARTEVSFLLMEQVLRADGYMVINPGYPSTEETIGNLASTSPVERFVFAPATAVAAGLAATVAHRTRRR